MDLLNQEILVHSIQLIPEEIRGEIFNKLPQKDALNLRRVCQQWEKEVRNHYNFRIKLDERSPFFHIILQFRITDLEIIRLIDHQIQDPENPDPSAFQFKHPKLIKKLTISDSNLNILRLLGGDKISGKNLQQLLRNLSKSLIHLNIGLSPSSRALNYPLPPNISYDLKNLKHLQIAIHAEKTELFNPNCPTVWENFDLKQINNSKASLNLTSLKIHLIDSDDLNFKHDRVVSAHLFSNEFSKRSDLILKQTRLKIINSNWLLPFDKGVFNSLVLNNYDTIVDISVSALTVRDTDVAFHLQIFNGCRNLKNLHLNKDFIGEGPNIYGLKPHLVNLTHLPKSLRKLRLSALHILTKDISALLNSDVVNELEDIDLDSCGIRGELGVNSKVLEMILSSESIKKFKVVGFNSTDGGDVLRLHEIFDRLGQILMGDLDQCQLVRYRHSEDEPYRFALYN